MWCKLAPKPEVDLVEDADSMCRARPANMELKGKSLPSAATRIKLSGWDMVMFAATLSALTLSPFG